jgi:hypothetical protein
MELALFAPPQVRAQEPSVKATALKKLTLAAAFALMGSLASAAVLTQGDANYVGLINDNIPSNPASEVDNINGLIQLAAGAAVQDCPDPATAGENCDRLGSTLAGPFAAAIDPGDDSQKVGNVLTINLTESFQYILGKYDAGSAGALVWYFAGGISGEITLPGTLNGLGLSHISWYNLTEGGGDDDEIPEPGSLALLGLGLLAAAGARRKRLR